MSKLKQAMFAAGIWGVGLLIIILMSFIFEGCGGTPYQPDFEEGFLYPAVWVAEDIPLRVICAGYTEERDADCEYIYRAMNVWNTAIGQDIFQRTRPNESFDVIVVTGAPSFREVRNEIMERFQTIKSMDSYDFRIRTFGEVNNSAFATLRWSGGSFHDCHIGIGSNTQNSELLHLISVHELGHCLNLAHDRYESSIMYWEIVPASWNFSSWPQRISDYDRSIIRTQYFE